MTKGYKATYNYQCRGQIYEIGQEYKLDQKPRICKYGFHYCLDAKYTLFYYDYNHKFKLLEIEDLSNDTIIQDDKSCSNHVRIIREITDPEELLNLLGSCYIYDKHGRELFYKDSRGFWEENTYNEKGNVLTHKNSRGYSFVATYDERGNELTYKDDEDFWRRATYDEKGYRLTFENSDGFKCEYLIDKNGWRYQKDIKKGN